jgi:ribonuclease III
LTADGSAPENRLIDLQARLGYTFSNGRLLEEALTHSSFQGSGRERRRSYERLEFLGDRVLGLVVANVLLRRFPGDEVGALARRYAALVRREACVEVAENLGIGRCVRLSRGEEDAGGRQSPGLLADACEALIAAVFLDDGFERATDVVERLWGGLIERDASPPKDAKTALQEWAQGQGLPLPQYREMSRSGPPHLPQFCVRVSVEGFEPEDAIGPSKRVAEQAAAEQFLAKAQIRDGG